MRTLCLFSGLLLIVDLNGCKKPHDNNTPSYLSNITKNRSWSGNIYKQLETPVGIGNLGKDAYNQNVTDASITITALSNISLKVSGWSAAVSYRKTDSAAQTMTFDTVTLSGTENAKLVYYYNKDSITLSNYTYEGSEYGFDDPYVVGSYYTSK